MSFETLINQFNTFDFTLPKYQRKFIWTKEQITNLAVSLIKNIPIPPIYVYKDKKTNKYIILDGQQRVISLFLYYYGLFVEPNKRETINFYEILSKTENQSLFEILKIKKGFKNVEYDFKDENGDTKYITFSKLPDKSKRDLKIKYIDVVVLDVTSDKKKETIYSNIFKLLNDGGTPLKQQEIRNGVFASDFYDMLYEVSEKYFRDIYKKQHGKDIELLLRFLAFEYVSDNDNGVIKIKEHKKTKNEELGFNGLIHILLDDFSQMGLLFTKEQINEYKNKIVSFLDDCKFNSDDVKTGKHILFESIYVAYSKLGNKITITSDLLNKIINETNKAKEFRNTAELTDIASVEKRINIAYRILKDA